MSEPLTRVDLAESERRLRSMIFEQSSDLRSMIHDSRLAATRAQTAELQWLAPLLMVIWSVALVAFVVALEARSV